MSTNLIDQSSMELDITPPPSFIPSTFFSQQARWNNYVTAANLQGRTIIHTFAGMDSASKIRQEQLLLPKSRKLSSQIVELLSNLNVKRLISPNRQVRGYLLIVASFIGEHGTGKTSLIQLAVDDA